jgi:hypothetical protein
VVERETITRRLTMVGFMEKRQELSREMAQLNYELYQSNKFILPLSVMFGSNMWENSHHPSHLWREHDSAVNFMQSFEALDDGRDTPLFNFVRNLNADLAVLKDIPVMRNISEDINSGNIHRHILFDSLAKKFKQITMPGVNQNKDAIFDMSMTIDDKEITLYGWTLSSATCFASCLLESVWNKYSNILAGFNVISRDDKQKIDCFRCFFSAVESLDYSKDDLIPFHRVTFRDVINSLERSLDVNLGGTPWYGKLISKYKLFPEQALASFKITTSAENMEKFMI